MEWIVVPRAALPSSYISSYETRAEADKAAEKLAREQGINVAVAQVVTTYVYAIKAVRFDEQKGGA